MASQSDESPAVAAALRRAFELLAGARSNPGAYAAAFECVAPHLNAAMSKRQRMQVLYVVALAQATLDPPAPALAPIDDALALALELDDTRTMADLLLLRASVNRAIHQVPDAVEDLQISLGLLGFPQDGQMPTPADAERIMDALLHQAGSQFYLGEAMESERLLDAAEHLLPAIPDHALQAALLLWTRALLLRWRGAYELALTGAMSAADTYAARGDPDAVSRIQGVVGEIALDLAERCQQQGYLVARDAFLALADPYIQRAIAVAEASDTGASKVMARIIETRLHLLRGEPGDRRPLLQELAGKGWENRDMAVVAQAYTALGGECEALGERDAAIEWYRKAVAALRESKMKALGAWAQRALWRLVGETQPSSQ